MKTRIRWLATGAIPLTLIALGWIAYSSRTATAPSAKLELPPQVATHAPPEPKLRLHVEPPKPARPSGAALVAEPEAEKKLPDWSVPLDAAIPVLREAAEAGDTTAQIEQSVRLSVCTKSSLRRALSADEDDRQAIEDDKENARLTDEMRNARAANAQLRIDTNTYNRGVCTQLPEDVRAHWLDSLDRAARSGSIDAKLQYAQLALSDYDSVDAIVADVDEAITRRDKARTYLLEALESGDQRSLRDLSFAYASRSDSRPHAFPPDTIKSYAYAYAGMLAGAIQPNVFDWMISNNGEPLDGAPLANAQAEGRSIYERCCVKH